MYFRVYAVFGETLLTIDKKGWAIRDRWKSVALLTRQKLREVTSFKLKPFPKVKEIFHAHKC